MHSLPLKNRKDQVREGKMGDIQFNCKLLDFGADTLYFL